MTASNNSLGRVAVIMTCYNEGLYIGEAVRSVLDQSRADLIDQIVIADDGSAPETITVLQDISSWDCRITIIYGTGGVGLPGQRRLAIGQTDAPFIAILDGDDLWGADKLEREMPLFADPAIGMVYSDYFTFADGAIDSARRAGVVDITGAPNLVRQYFLNDPPIIPSTTVIRRTAYDACGGFDAAVRVFEDTDFYLRIARVTRFALVDAPLLYKRNRKTSITGGRKDLMAHHAFVALKAAAETPALLTLVPERLSERARKLGNHRFLMNDVDGALGLLSFAVRTHPLNRRAWTSLIAVRFFPRLALKMLGSRGRERQMAMGVTN